MSFVHCVEVHVMATDSVREHQIQIRLLVAVQICVADEHDKLLLREGVDLQQSVH